MKSEEISISDGLRHRQQGAVNREDTPIVTERSSSLQKARTSTVKGFLKLKI
jgi:hypothetical protein